MYWKSVQWEPSCSMRTDRRMDRQTDRHEEGNNSFFAVLRKRLEARKPDAWWVPVLRLKQVPFRYVLCHISLVIVALGILTTVQVAQYATDVALCDHHIRKGLSLRLLCKTTEHIKLLIFQLCGDVPCSCLF
jgi:hypothetical protein